MKNCNIHSSYLFIMAVLVLFSCTKFEDSYKDFIGDGEIKYSARPDSLMARGGINSVQLSWLFTTDPNITSYKIYWNNRRDSIMKTIVRSSGVDTIKVLISGLEEGVYNFEIFTYDNKGNTSIKSEVVGSSYGARYIATLLPRGIRATNRVDKNMIFTWAPGADDLLYTDLSYTDMDGHLVNVRIKKSDEFTELVNFPVGSAFNIQSFFKPDRLALDTVFTPNVVQKFVLQSTYTGWSDYNIIFGHSDELIVRKSSGNLDRFSYSTGIMPAFVSPPTANIGVGWGGFTNIFSLNDGRSVVSWNKTDGSMLNFLYRKGQSNSGVNPLASAGSAAANQAKTWDFTFSAQKKIFGRSNTGALRYYSVANYSSLSAVSTVTGVDWSKYNAMAGLLNTWVFGRTANGDLYRIAIDLSTNTASDETLVATGWDKFRIISSFMNELVAAEGYNLWVFPVNADGTLGIPRPGIYSEVIAQ